jgi:uncharacterized protein YdeI (YjbR/CyaY-like superfamily)
MNPLFFPTPASFRTWLQKNHATETELWVGYYKKVSGKQSITWEQAVLEALCFGWIDGVRQSIDEESFRQRFTPRKKGSTWSLVNVNHVKRLTKEGLMHPAGLAAFQARTANKTGIYSAENRDKAVLPPELEKRFKAEKKAWKNFQAMAPSYKSAAIWLVISAKQEATREKRLQELIECSAKGTTIKTLTRKSVPKGK